MISYIRGTLEEILENGIVVEACGIGYFISVPPSTSSRLRLKSEVKIYTYMDVKEDSVALFGFESRAQQTLFKKLTSVSGIGGKTAMGLLGVASVNDITAAIVSNDIDTLCRAPGLGKKTAQRIVLELKDKISNEEISMAVTGGDILDSPDRFMDSRVETIEALVALGYSKSEAAKAISAVYSDGDDTTALLKKSLKKISER